MRLRRISRILVSTLAVLGGCVFSISRATPALADSCSDCGESKTELYFYTGDGSASVTSIPYGQPLLMDALVLDDSGSCDIGDCNTPSGHVYFFDNGATGYFTLSPTDPNYYTPIGDPSINNLTSFEATVANLAPGVHSIRAFYQAGFHSASNPHTFDDSEDTKSITITKAPVSVTLGNGSPNPSAYGQSVSFAVTVTPNPAVDPSAAKPTGKVQLTLPGDATVYAEATIDANGAATLTTSSLPVGTHTQLAAAYVGDTNYDAHLSNNVTRTVSKATTSTVLTASPNPGTFGQSTLLTAAVTPSTATGTVTFKDGTSSLGTGTISGGTATLNVSNFTAGTHALTAVYGGDGNLLGSTGSLSYFVGKAATTTQLTSSPQPTKFGQATTLTATVSPNTATGTITFYDGATSIGTGTLALVSGTPTAMMSTSSLAVGSHSLSAAYGGDANHESSTSSTFTHVVQKADTATTLSPASTSVDFGSSVPLTVNVGAVAPGAGTPTGTVQLLEGGALVASTTLGGASASFTVPDLLPGTHTLVATYGGDGNFNGSTSNNSVITVTCQQTRTGTVSGNYVAGSGSTCFTGSGTVITGNLYIGSGSRVFLSGARVNGSINSFGASRLALCGVTSYGRVTISGTNGPVLLGDTVNGRCAGNKFPAVSVDGTDGSVTIADNTMASLGVTNNHAPVGGTILVAANHITGALSCSGNTPLPSNGGRVNSAGAKWGQCSGL